MEVYKRKVGYEDFARTMDLVVTSTTLNFPIMLTQNFEDIGIYTDTKNPIYEIIEFSSIWNLTNNGISQKTCGVINNCTVNFTEVPIAYFGANNGVLSTNVTNCTPVSYQWTGPNGFGTTPTQTTPNVNGLISGNYSLKIVDSNCDITYVSYFLQQPQGLSFNLLSTNSQVNDVNGTCNGSASAIAQGGVPPYYYLWYSGVTTNVISQGINVTGITNLCSGSYNVQITDSTPQPLGPVIVSGIFNITEPNTLSGSVITQTNIECSGGNTGSITVKGVGGTTTTGYTYTLTPTSQVINTASDAVYSNLTAGNYVVQIKDDVGSIFNLNVALTSSSPLTFSYSVSNGVCYGDLGSITVTPAGGTSPYNIEITQISTSILYSLTTNTQNDLTPDIYQIKVTDSNGCVSPVVNVNVLQRAELGLTYTLPSLVNGYDIACFGDTITVPFVTSYLFDTYITNPSSNTLKYYINGVLKATSSIAYGSPSSQNLVLSAGTNVIEAIDQNGVGCSVTKTIVLTQPAMPLSITYGVIAINDSALSCGAGSDDCRQGVIDINGGVAPYTITWGGGTNQPPTDNYITSAPDCAGQTITVTVTDANGCIIGPISILLSI